MKVIDQGKVTITAEAGSPKAIEKLLEQALFELRLSSTEDNGYQQAFSKAAKGDQSGTMGSYNFEYTAPVIEYDEPL